ncbi:hypothetical protein Pelo_15937 [Pelomyxa schiedti]|nr:hypothetical protein Pelo_15937 [Pelomyxa schiedti]
MIAGLLLFTVSLYACCVAGGALLAGNSWPSTIYTLNASDSGSCVWTPVYSTGTTGEVTTGVVDRLNHIYYMFIFVYEREQVWSIDLDTGQVLTKVPIQVSYYDSPIWDSATGNIYLSAVNDTAAMVYSLCALNKDSGYCDVISTIASSWEYYGYSPSWNQVDQQYIKVWDIREGVKWVQELITVDVPTGNILNQVATDYWDGMTSYDNTNKRILYVTDTTISTLDPVSGFATKLCSLPETYYLDSVVVSDAGDTLFISGSFPNSIGFISYDLNKCAVNYKCQGPSGGFFFAGLL